MKALLPIVLVLLTASNVDARTRARTQARAAASTSSVVARYSFGPSGAVVTTGTMGEPLTVTGPETTVCDPASSTCTTSEVVTAVNNLGPFSKTDYLEYTTVANPWNVITTDQEWFSCVGFTLNEALPDGINYALISSSGGDNRGGFSAHIYNYLGQTYGRVSFYTVAQSGKYVQSPSGISLVVGARNSICFGSDAGSGYVILNGTNRGSTTGQIIPKLDHPARIGVKLSAAGIIEPFSIGTINSVWLGIGTPSQAALQAKTLEFINTGSFTNQPGTTALCEASGYNGTVLTCVTGGTFNEIGVVAGGAITSTTTTCTPQCWTSPANTLAIGPQGALIYGTRTSQVLNNQRSSVDGSGGMRAATWIKNGSVSVTAECVTDPLGGCTADEVTLEYGAANNIRLVVGGLTVGNPLATSVWIRRHPSHVSGVVEVFHPGSSIYGKLTIDLSKLPTDWTRISVGHPALTAATAFSVAPSGSGGLGFVSWIAGTTKFHVWRSWQQEGPLGPDAEVGAAPLSVAATTAFVPIPPGAQSISYTVDGVRQTADVSALASPLVVGGSGPLGPINGALSELVFCHTPGGCQ